MNMLDSILRCVLPFYFMNPEVGAIHCIIFFSIRCIHPDEINEILICFFSLKKTRHILIIQKLSKIKQITVVTYTIKPCLTSTVNDCQDKTTRRHPTVAVTDGRLVKFHTLFSQNWNQGYCMCHKYRLPRVSEIGCVKQFAYTLLIHLSA